MLNLHYTNKCTTLNTYKTFIILLQHVSVYYVPSSGKVIRQVGKPKLVVFITDIVRVVWVAVDYKINLKCGYSNDAYSAVYKICYL
jgi:hypothetical protein